MRARRAVLNLALALLAVAACGGPGRGDPTVEVGVPSIEPRRVNIRTLEPGPTPTPTPMPTPTPVPATPGPTPQPLSPPRGSTITAASGTQRGAPNSYCWTSGGQSTCFDNPPPNQPTALAVRQGERTILRIEADRGPDEEAIRPFQGSRAGYPSTRVEAALETELTIDLRPGEWQMDVCATWFGHGETVCWLYALQVT